MVTITSTSTANRLSMENDYVAFKFVRDTTIHLTEIINKAMNKSFTISNDPLWYVRIYDPSIPQYRTIDERAGGIPEYITTVTDSLDQLVTLRWKNVRVIPREYIDVAVCIELPADTGIANFNLHIENNLRTVYLADTSLSIGVVRSRTENDFAVIPIRGGQEIEVPSVNIVNSYLLDRIELPTHGVMQLAPYYTESKNGLYVATHDGDNYHKTFNFEGGQGRFLYKINQPIPDTFNVSKNFDLPYEVKIGVYSGDWYEASKIYRSWAVDQSWLHRGKLKTRTDVPTWLKDIQLVHTSIGSFIPYTGTLTTPEVQVHEYSQIRSFYGLNDMMIMWQASNIDDLYQEMKPELSETAIALKDEDIYSLVYTFPQTYPVGSTSIGVAGEDSYVRNIDGSVYVNGSVFQLDITTQYTQSKITDMARKLAITGMYGVYLDAAFSFEDYSTSASRPHLPGGGNYFVQGYSGRFGDIRDTMRTYFADGGVVFTEVGAENFIGETDFALTDLRTFPTTLDQTKCRYVPILQSVYHDYGLIIGTNDRVFYAGIFASIDTFDACHAFGFNYGAVPTEREDCFTSTLSQIICNALGPEKLTVNMPILVDHTTFMQSMIDARTLGEEFLKYGELLRPLNTDAEEVTHTILDTLVGGIRNSEIRMPKIFSSVWLADNDDIGIVFINYTNSSNNITYTFEYNKYPISGTKNIYRMHGGGDIFLESVDSDFTRTETVNAKAVLILRLSSS